jgi:hypothetical protein
VNVVRLSWQVPLVEGRYVLSVIMEVPKVSMAVDPVPNQKSQKT